MAIKKMQNRITSTELKITLNVEVLIIKEDEYYVAYCPALEISAYGDTEKKVKKAFNTEVNIFVEETHKRGTLEKYLLKNGWRLQQTPELKYEPPRPNTDKLFGLIKSKESSLIHQEVNIPVC